MRWRRKRPDQHLLDAEALLAPLIDEHTRRSPRGVVFPAPFSYVEQGQRTFAISRSGSTSSQEAVPYYLVVDLQTGANYRFQRAHENVPPALLDPSLIGADDPVRRWLATDPTAGLTPVVPIATADQLERYCAAEIVRTDRPDLLAHAQLRSTPELAAADRELLNLMESSSHAQLPYRVLFRRHWLGVDPSVIGDG